jgi:hypothetical protein
LIAADAIALELDEPGCAASDLAPGVAALPGKALRVERCSATIGAVLILAKAGMVDHPSVVGRRSHYGGGLEEPCEAPCKAIVPRRAARLSNHG